LRKDAKEGLKEGRWTLLKEGRIVALVKQAEREDVEGSTQRKQGSRKGR
jgi:hypothetical protein